jgi:hypothetical protein
MDLQNSVMRDTLWTRLKELRNSGAGAKAKSFTPIAIISALRMILNLYPRRFRTDSMIQDRMLRAFVSTVIPGADEHHPDLVRMYSDTYYPFYPYTGYLVYDLARRSRALFGIEALYRLDGTQRTAVVEAALSADDTTARLYRGAMLMAQVSFFAGVYDPDHGCSLIDFPGKNEGFSTRSLTYPEACRYLGTEVTNDGNPP